MTIHAYKLFIAKTRWPTEIFNTSLRDVKFFTNIFHGKLKSGIYINNNLINNCQEDQHWIWKCHDFIIRIISVFNFFFFHFKSYIPRMTQVSDLLPSIGIAGHLSQIDAGENVCSQS